MKSFFKSPEIKVNLSYLLFSKRIISSQVKFLSSSSVILELPALTLTVVCEFIKSVSSKAFIFFKSTNCNLSKGMEIIITDTFELSDITLKIKLTFFSLFSLDFISFVDFSAGFNFL